MKTLDEKVIKLAEEMAKAFETRERENGQKYVCLKDRQEKQWMKDVIRKAHGDLLPNDYVYKFVENTVDLISECDTLDETDERYCEIEGDIYNNDLLEWISANLTFSAYVDEALEDYETKDLFTALSIGQSNQKREVFNIVLNELKDLAESVE